MGIAVDVGVGAGVDVGVEADVGVDMGVGVGVTVRVVGSWETDAAGDSDRGPVLSDGAFFVSFGVRSLCLGETEALSFLGVDCGFTVPVGVNSVFSDGRVVDTTGEGSSVRSGPPFSDGVFFGSACIGVVTAEGAEATAVPSGTVCVLEGITSFPLLSCPAPEPAALQLQPDNIVAKRNNVISKISEVKTLFLHNAYLHFI